MWVLDDLKLEGRVPLRPGLYGLYQIPGGFMCFWLKYKNIQMNARLLKAQGQFPKAFPGGPPSRGMSLVKLTRKALTLSLVLYLY